MPMSPELSPCKNVLASSYDVVSKSEFVTIVAPKLTALAVEIADIHSERPVLWDESSWHLTSDGTASGDARVALYVLALDALNFCFWPSAGGALQYDHMALALKTVALSNEGGDYPLSAERLATITEEELKGLLEPHLPCALPALSSRCRNLNEVGQVLVNSYKGDPLQFLSSCDSSAESLVSLVLSSFPSFRDSSVDALGLPRPFYKRAQILVADLWAALSARSPADFKDVDSLTTFADYRVPQLLRDFGALVYGEGLAEKVDGGKELRAGGDEEIEIRAATVVAVDRLVKEVRDIRSKDEKKKGLEDINAVKMDWYLWQRGEKLEGKGEMKPHHKVRTIFY